MGREVLTYYDQSPWKASQNASEFCQLNDLQESIRSQLRQEDKFTTTIAGFRYTVKERSVRARAKWLVFRRNLDDVKISSDSKNLKNDKIIEIKIVPLNEANGYLRSKSCEFHIFSNDPVKVVKDEIFVVMVRRAYSKVN